MRPTVRSGDKRANQRNHAGNTDTCAGTPRLGLSDGTTVLDSENTEKQGRAPDSAGRGLFSCRAGGWMVCEVWVP